MAVVTATWRSVNSIAPQAIYNSWGVLTTLSETQSGRDSVRGLMRICDKLSNPSDITNGVFNWLSNAVSRRKLNLSHPLPPVSV